MGIRHASRQGRGAAYMPWGVVALLIFGSEVKVGVEIAQVQSGRAEVRSPVGGRSFEGIVRRQRDQNPVHQGRERGENEALRGDFFRQTGCWARDVKLRPSSVFLRA